MHVQEFKRILATFADSVSDVDVARGQLLVQMRDDVIHAHVYQKDFELWVAEDDQHSPAVKWLVDRVARLPLLAERILAHVPEQTTFVPPAGRLLEQPDYEG